MMLSDLVIDTNVLLHADNPIEERQASALALIRLLLDSKIAICVDEGFNPNESQNRSAIAGEYLLKLRFGSIGLQLIATLASTGRVRQLPRRPVAAKSRRINQLVRNTYDRAFLGVACNSADRILVSHDYEDFQAAKRDKIRKVLEVDVIEASLCFARCSSDAA